MDIRELWCNGLGFMVLLLCFMQIAKASEPPTYQSIESIQATALGYVNMTLADENYQLITESGKMDKRLRLLACDAPLKAFIPYHANSSNKISVGISCQGSHLWTVYVPVFVKKMAEVVTVNRNLSRNTLIDNEDISVNLVDIIKLPHGYFTDEKDVRGMVVKKNLRFGEVVSPIHLTPPILIKRGAKVKLMTKGRGVSVSAEGQALENGAAGDWITVRNLRSQRIVEGTVMANGIVQIPLAQ